MLFTQSQRNDMLLMVSRLSRSVCCAVRCGAVLCCAVLRCAERLIVGVQRGAQRMQCVGLSCETLIFGNTY